MKTGILFFLIFAAASIYGQNLDQYLEMAAEQNPGLKAKYAQFEAALERVSQENSLPDPTLSFGYFISPVETRVGPQKARFSLTQMFPWFGTLRSKEDAAAFRAEAKYHEFLDAQNRLYYQVSKAYYLLYELQGLIEVERENERILGSYKDIATVKFQNNKGSMVDVLRVDIMLQESSTDLSILNQKIAPVETQFNNLLNRDEDTPVNVGDSLHGKELNLSLQEDSLFTANPIIKQLDLKIKASQAQEEAAVKKGHPSFGLGLDYVIVGERPEIDLKDNGKDVFMPMVTFSLPIFRSQYKAARAEARHLQESYTYEREEVSNNLMTSYEMVRFEIQKQLELGKLYDAQIQESEQSLGLLFSSYSNSGTDFEEVLRMQQQILKYRKLKIAATAAYYTAVAELQYITAKSI